MYNIIPMYIQDITFHVALKEQKMQKYELSY